jgi:hypothetical protein
VFDPTHENWFWARVTDYWGLTYKGSGKSHEIDPPPAPVDVDSVWYDEQIMTVTWGISEEADFDYYELFISDTEYGNRRPVVKIGDINRTNYIFRHFDPTKENWFTVNVVDKWGLTSTGRAKTNEANEPPEPIRITSVDYNFEQFNITWRKTTQADFSFYDLLVSNERDGKLKRLVTLTSVDDTTYTINGRGVFDPTREHWFWIRTGDTWGQEVTGPGYRVLDDPPLMSYFHSVEYRKDQFIFTWAPNGEDELVLTVFHRVKIRHERRIIQNPVARACYLLPPGVPRADPEPMLPSGVEHTPAVNSVCCIIHRSKCHQPL